MTDREHRAIAALPALAWTPAIDIAGDPRESAEVAELTGVLPAAMLADYRPGCGSSCAANVPTPARS